MSKIRVITVGGLGEIGKNMTLFESENTLVSIDAGIMFPTFEMYGIDFVIPDLNYIRSNQDKFKAIIVTHGHEDHIGAIPFIIKEFPSTKIYATKLALGMIRNRIQSLERQYKNSIYNKNNFIEIQPGYTYKIGDFVFTPFRVNHSIADAVGIAFFTDEGVIIHTGDFKIDNTPIDGEIFDYHTLSDFGKKGVLLLLSDSTNVANKGFSKSEKEISENLQNIITKASGKVIVATFSSNIHRIQQIAEISFKAGKKVFVSGYSLEKNIELAHKLGYLNLPFKHFYKIEDVKNYSPKDVVAIVSGTQGEPLSVLTKIAENRYPDLKITKGDVVILSSSTIPGNEPMVTGIINKLFELGAEVYSKEFEDVHVSGHASQEELKIMLNITRPKYFVPIHGEYKHLHLHKELAKTIGIDDKNIFLLKDGDIIEIDNGRIRYKGNIEPEEVFVDGKGIGDISDIVLKDRQILAADGIVVVVITLDTKETKLYSDPEILSRGFILVNNSEEFIEKSKEIVIKTVKKWEEEKHRDFGYLKKKIKSNLKKYFNKSIARDPMILSLIITV